MSDEEVSPSPSPSDAASFENEQQFWSELEELISVPCPAQKLIDTRLRSFFLFVTTYREDYINSDYDMARCAFKLLESPMFEKHSTYVRRRIIGRFLKEPPNSTNLHLMTAILLYDGRENKKCFEMMMEASAFSRLVNLIWKDIDRENQNMVKLLMELFYEMSRIQQLRIEDLEVIDDDFVKYLFELIEEGDSDPDDPYNYAVVRLLVSIAECPKTELVITSNQQQLIWRQLVLNEQYMVSEHAPNNKDANGSAILTNKIIKILSYYGPDYKTFGENIILLLNRESETCLQLLILKLMYLLFTTSKTHEYFYTNDLCVLVDVMIRNLSDLPDENAQLRHTYLRVLYPLLSHTQLRHPPHYKRAELITLLRQLSDARSQHFSPVDPTTLRLVSRCNNVPWLDDTKTQEKAKEAASKHLGMTLNHQAGSSMSVVEVAAIRERPGVQTGSKKAERGEKPAPPPPPPTRKKRAWRVIERVEDGLGSLNITNPMSRESNNAAAASTTTSA